MPSRLVIIPLENPLPGQVKPRMIKEIGSNAKSQATLRHRAALRVFLKQLCGLENCTVHFTYSNEHDEFPIQQLISPLIEELPHWKLIPHEIHHAPNPTNYLNHHLTNFQKVALLNPDCLNLSSRWTHTAFAQLNETSPRVTGSNKHGTPYLTAQHQSGKSSPVTELPQLPLLETDKDWQTLLQSPLGPYLKKSYDQLTINED